MHARFRSQGVAGMMRVCAEQCRIERSWVCGKVALLWQGRQGTVRNGAGLSGDLGVGGKVAPPGVLYGGQVC